MLHRIRTYTRSERAAAVALLAISVGAAAVLLLVSLAGDQRTLAVVAASPAPGEQVPVTLRAITLSFDREPDRDAVAARLVLEPPVPGTVQWRGRTLEYVFAEAPGPGPYRLALPGGSLGRGGERLAEDFALDFEVREPGIILVQADGDTQQLVAVREGAAPTVLLTAAAIRHFAVAPSDARVAVITGAEPGLTELVLIDTATGAVETLVSDPAFNLATVTWSFDGNAMLVVRRDRLPDGSFGAPRVWLTRLSGEFVQRISEEDVPSTAAAWSPDGQNVAFISPATSEVLVLNLSTRVSTRVGIPRSSALDWSPDSRLLAFVSSAGVPEGGDVPLQPIRVRSLDGTLDFVLGEEGEVRSHPRFLDATTVMSLRRTLGADSRGTDLVFESVEDGRVLRGVLLAPAGVNVLDWDLDPSGRRIVYSVVSGQTTVTLIRDLESGDREPLEVTGARPAWLP